MRKTRCLGTVQLGSKYGIANVTGAPSRSDSIQILKYAYDHGISNFDTARAYGDSEKVIGDFLKTCAIPRSRVRIATKLAPSKSARELDASFEESLRSLGVDAVDVLMFHRWSNRKDFGIPPGLRGCYKTLGVSVIDFNEAMAAIRDPDMKFIQIPCNLLDWRWRNEEWVKLCESRRDVEIQCRSVLLQGILADGNLNGAVMHEFQLAPLFERLDRLAKRFDFSSRTAFAFAYIDSLAWVQNIVFGVDHLEHLKYNLGLLGEHRQLPSEAMAEIAAEFGPTTVSEKLIQPHLWGESK